MAGDLSVSCDPTLISDLGLECSHTCWIPVASTVSKVTSLEAAVLALAGIPAFFPLCPLDLLFPPGKAYGPQLCSISAPPEKMSPLLTVLPLPCCFAGGLPLLLTGPRSLNLLLLEACEARSREVKRTHLPSRRSPHLPTSASYSSTQAWGSNPDQQLPLVRPATTSCNQN